MTEGSNARVWWIQPHTVIWVILLPLFLALPLLPSPPNDVKTYFGGEYYVLGIGLLLITGAGAWLGQLIVPPLTSRPADRFRVRAWWLDVLFLLTLTAYVVWFLEILLDPTLLLAATQFGAFEVKAQVSNIPGITSFTQAGIPFFISYFIAARYCGQRLPARFRVYMAILFLLTCLRVFVWTEREALIEIVIPVLLLVVSSWRPRRPLARKLLLLAPLIGLLALLFFFGATEYFRSWITFYAGQEDSFFAFLTTRVSNYYVTAVNNALAFLTESDGWPRWDAASVLSGLYAMPLLGDILKEAFDVRPNEAALILNSYLDPEFNNSAGLYASVGDFGVIAGTGFLLAFGVVAGWVWKLFVRKSLGGLLFYPLIYMTIIELLRVLYIGGSRSVIPLLLLALAYSVGFRRRKSEQPVHDR